MRNTYWMIRAVSFFVLLHSVINTYAQNFCAFDKIRSSINNNYPAIAKNIAGNEKKLKQIIIQKHKQPENRGMTIYTIPIVVHVLHTGDDAGTVHNPDSTQIIEAINYLNNVYSGTDASLTPAGTDAAGDIGIRFVLAKRDPDCNPTNGINRINMSDNLSYIINGAIYNDIESDIALKTPIAWDKTRYYNIYIVNKITEQGGNTATAVSGYAYLPINSVVDGTVLLASEMKAGSNTLVHEIGHAFNLYHPFEGSFINTQCPTVDNDMVADTDPISFNIDEDGNINYLCRTGPNNCNNNLPYSIRTEANFMNYSACKMLFTPGQKERMRASLILEDRKSLTTSTGAIPTYLNPVCSPKVNFENDAVELDRVDDSLLGCRRYKDYSVFLTITSNPATNLGAEIQVDPTSDAVEDIDYAFPEGKKIVFPAGSNSRQPFKIRVFGHENNNILRTLKLGFSMGSGGDSFKGTACIVMNVRILPLNTSPILPASIAAMQVGKRDENITGISIFNGGVNSQKTQLLYRANELKKAGIIAGNIAGLHFFILKNTTHPFKTINIKIGHTTFNELVNNGTVNVVNNVNPVASYSSFQTVYGWNNFIFNTPFKWNGTDNIVIELCINNDTGADFGIDDIYAYADTGSVARGNTIYSTNEDCEKTLLSVSYYSKGIRPVIRFDYVNPGNPVADTLTISSTQYVGPFSEVYFYDKSPQRKIIAKLKNLTSWNYGCTNIRIDRYGNKTMPFWNNIKSQYLAQKTLTVTPEKNTANGKYEITLYYTNAEKTGFEMESRAKWENIKIIRADVPISTITPQNPQTDKVQIRAIRSFSSFGTAYTITTDFTSSLSSYGVGFASTNALPVEFGNVHVSVVNKNVLLKWETITEINNDYFEVEKSNEGVNFERLAQVPGKGNSNAISNYQYLHINPLVNGKIFYRIKQVDKDGTQTYSKIVYANLQNPNNVIPTIYPVPANSIITISFGKDVSQPIIEIYSTDLRRVGIYRRNGSISSDNINIQHLSSGSYFIKLSYEGKKHLLRFIKM